jgi:MATE family multidrug resistance protein
VIGVLLNIPLTYVLIFGLFGLPALGIAGAALGTVVAAFLSIGVYLLFYFNAIHAKRFKVRVLRVRAGHHAPLRPSRSALGS